MQACKSYGRRGPRRRRLAISISNGFTIVEMAIVMLVISLLIGSLLQPLSSFLQERAVAKTRQNMNTIKEALLGFVAANGRLPRPAIAANDGRERAAACASEAQCTGLIPWRTLGISQAAQFDAWEHVIRYSVTPQFANALVSVKSTDPVNIQNTVPTKTVQTRAEDSVGARMFLIGQSAPCTTASGCVPVILYSTGPNGNFGTTGNGAFIPNQSALNSNFDERDNNAASTSFVARTSNDRDSVAGGEFDDLIDWIPHGVLVNRIVATN